MIQVQRHVLIVSLYASNAVVSCYPQLHDTITGPEAQASGPVIYSKLHLCAPLGGHLRCAFCCFVWVVRPALPCRLPACRRNKISAVVRASAVCGPCVAPGALGKRRGPIPAVACGSWLARAARALRLPATPPARNTPALPWQGARPLTRRLRPPLPRLRGCVAVWGRARVVKLRARGLAGGCAGSPPSGPLRGVAWALHGGGLGGRPLGRPFGRVAPPAVLRVGLCLFPAFVVSGLGLRRVSRSFASVKGRARGAPANAAAAAALDGAPERDYS